MSIKQQGGIFGRNPTFNDVTVDGTLTVNGEPISDFGTMAQQDANNVNIDGGAIDGTPIGATTPSTVKASTFITYGNLLINRASVTTGAVIEASYAGGVAEYGMEFRPDVDDTVAILFKAAGGALIASIKQFSNHITIDVGNGGGIDFSATAGTGTSELFDDYEEGTWTPTFTAEWTTAPTVTSAQYTKVGRQVTVTLLATGGVVTAGGGIGGLPFASNSAQGAGAYGGNSDTTESLQGTVGQSASSITNIPARTLTGDTWQITATYFT